MAERLTTHLPRAHRNAPVKVYCRAATTANITISTALNNGDTLDGITLATGDRVLVKDQSTGSQNGIYVVAASPARAYDMDASAEVQGVLVYVLDGTANAGTLWANTNLSAVTLETTAITFAEVSGGSVPAGTYELAIEGGQSVINPDAATLGAAKTWDPTLGNVHTGTLDQDCTFTISAPSGSGASTLEFWITQDGTGGWDITWPGSVTWDGGTPTPDTTAGTTVRYILESIDGGTNWIGNMVGGGATSPLTTKGDLWGYDTADARVPVGTDTYLLNADSTDTQGVAWISPESTGHYEVLMDGSGTADPLEDGSGADWLYVWVP